MIKKILLILLTILIVGSLIYLYYWSNNKYKALKCDKIKVLIQYPDNTHSYMSDTDVTKELKYMNIHLKGKFMDSIDRNKIEQILTKNPLFRGAQVSLSYPDKAVVINIAQKDPKYMVLISDSLYYVSTTKQLIPANYNYLSKLPIVTGDVNKENATGEIYNFVDILQHDTILNNYFGQICLDSIKGVILTPKVSNTPIIFGFTNNWQEKLDKMQLFLKKILPRLGWNKIKYVNLDFKDQIIVNDGNVD